MLVQTAGRRLKRGRRAARRWTSGRRPGEHATPGAAARGVPHRKA
ncbi:ABC transporter ATP-binding protein [Burkholderia pseudomallei]|uniref:Uncharacterized protein n=1 Tax=Burkholderia pseudomallei 1710a TaxID=320371 RepID=A0A0E1W7W3_BURPE|nr:hypothetical protein BURPS668_1645 [Burkholderia pseudomallei 668]ARK98671.1 ABC transporter ATP-binding protein [Burkholderia pseudomallei]EBA45863.1 hypothetical protein BURPS305_1027 [Burkholderia pseudomallei 305]EDO84627.1 ABC transporter system ATP-binding protein [Burkholderia pseudomallei 406e]EDS86866.1 hypothetical protein BURPSS13_P0302 [Burkholderia pseudomallei S13]EEC33209.1 conserved hypothetical protein [Burkholderia pseudomallei 576]EEH31027.1 conserved hypothetical protei